MKKRTATILAVLMLVVCVALGMGLGKLYTSFNVNNQQKPVINAAEKEPVIDAGTDVVFERVYNKCQHTIISFFPERDQLNGKRIKELQEIYSQTNGYQVEWSNNALIIRQVIDDWCPKDKEKLRLKEYQNRVAIFQGPDAKNDVLLEVTNIQMSSLPAEIRKMVQEGSMEFLTREELNDALENLDEYL